MMHLAAHPRVPRQGAGRRSTTSCTFNRPVRRKLTVSASQVSLEEDRTYLSQLPVSLIQSQLRSLGQNFRYVFEKSELVDLLAAARAAARTQVVRLPLRRAKATPESPKEYVLVPVDVGDEGFMEFALDSGASTTLITPEVRDRLGASPMAGAAVQGVSTDGMTVRQMLPLPPMRLGGQELRLSDAIVTDLQSPNLAGVDGMLGMQFLRQFDIELNFEDSVAAFYPPGSACPAGILDTMPMYSISCTPCIGGLMTVLVSLNGTARFPAIVDLATSFSVINSVAAQHANMEAVLPTTFLTASPNSDAEPSPVFRAAKPLMLTVGDQDQADGTLTVPVQSLLVTDLPVFAALQLDKSPTMLLAMDVLKQRTLVLSFASGKIYIKA